MTSYMKLKLAIRAKSLQISYWDTVCFLPWGFLLALSYDKMAEVHANKMITRGTFYRAWCGAYLELEWGEGEGSVGLKASERDAYL